MPEDRVIRPAAAGDEAAVTAVVVAAGMFPPDDTGPVEQLLSDYFGGASEEGHGFLVTSEGAELLGVAYYQPKMAADRAWDLTMIATRPHVQGEGVGTALLREIECALAAAGQRLLLVETSGLAQYVGARAFYVKCGYDEVARVADYWERGDDLVLFVKRLSND